MHPSVSAFVARHGRAPRLALFVAEDWHFATHRLPLARGAVDAGFEVTVLARYQQHGALISATGARTVSVPLRRGQLSLLAEVGAFRAVVREYRAHRPDIAHHVAMKPVIYGTLAAAIARVPRTINALAGLGYLFLTRTWRGRVLGAVARLALRWTLRLHTDTVILQNPDDIALLIDRGLVRHDQVALIRGSGVDLTRFAPTALPLGAPVVVLPARMLWDKGVGEFVEAARILRARGLTARFALVGGPDAENPTSVPRARLEGWAAEGVVEWWGNRDDMPEVLAQASIVCLPSYREGLPKALLEGAAAGRALVATDVPGCREAVREGVNGHLVPARDAGALAEALARLLADPAALARMGRSSREMAEREFSDRRVVEETLAIYAAVLDRTG